MNWNRPVNDDLIRLKQLYETECFLLKACSENWPERDGALANVRAEMLYLYQEITRGLNLAKNRTGL